MTIKDETGALVYNNPLKLTTRVEVSAGCKITLHEKINNHCKGNTTKRLCQADASIYFNVSFPEVRPFKITVGEIIQIESN